MGDIGVLLKIMPESPETDLEGIKKEIESRIDVEDMNEEDLAFGLKAIKVLTLVDDGEGGTEEVEEKLKGLEGVKGIEVEDVTKI